MSTNIDPSLWKLRTKGGIPYKLVEGYPKGSFEEEDASCTEQYIIKDTDLAGFVSESFSHLDGVYPGGSWEHIPARSYPESDENKEFWGWVVTTKVSFEPFDESFPGDPFGMWSPTSKNSDSYHAQAYPPKQDGTSTYDKTFTRFLKVTIEYSVGKATESDDDLLEITGNATGEYLTPQTKSSWLWERIEVSAHSGFPNIAYTTAPAKEPNILVGKVVPGVEWSAKYRRIPWAKLSDVVEGNKTTLGVLSLCRSMLGLVNSQVMPRLKNAPAETILFVGFSWTTKYTWRDPMPMSEIELKFLEKYIQQYTTVADHDYPNELVTVTLPPIGHNHFLNPTNMLFEKLMDMYSNNVYGSDDLNKLFKKVV